MELADETQAHRGGRADYKCSTNNGRNMGEYIRYALGLIAAGIVAYFTTVGTMQRDLAAQKATEESHFGEVLRRLDVLQADIRELRDRAR